MPPRKDLGHLRCSVANTLEVIGDHWTVLILRDAFMGVRRFDEFQADLGIARNILADRLERLVAGGILEIRPYRQHPPRHEYRLTEAGKDLFDVLLALWRWGDRWRPVADPDERHLVHLECGEPTHSVASCAHCGKPLSRGSLRIEPGLQVVASRPTASV